jgi:2-oxoisovalerate dehydrogenase E1 component beta subunit
VPELTYLEAITLALREELARDPRVVLIGEDIGRKGGVFGVTRGLQREFGPLRVMDAALAEVGIAGMAIGAAFAGLRPVAEFQFADYIHPAFDQIANEAATISYRSNGAWACPTVFRAPSGAGVHGGLYHSQSPEAYFVHVPGLKVIAPATPADARGLLKSAIRDDNPVVFFEHKGSYRRERGEVPTGSDGGEQGLVPIGEARLDRQGRDASVITYGVGVRWAREAADALAREGVAVEVLDLRTLRPFDKEAVARTVRKTSRVVIAHEANLTLGFGAEIAAFVAEELFDSLDAPVRRVAARDSHIPYAAAQETAIIPGPADVIAAIRKTLAY